MTTAAKIGAARARKVVAAGDLGTWIVLDLEKICGAEYAEGFWRMVETIANAEKAKKKR